MDDYFTHNRSLELMVEAMSYGGDWLISGTNNNATPTYTMDIETGNNRLGSPSALMMRNDSPLLFDERLSWLLDCELYKRMYERYKSVTILEGNHITIGVHDGQMTHILTDEQKLAEHELIKNKYA